MQGANLGGFLPAECLGGGQTLGPSSVPMSLCVQQEVGQELSSGFLL